LLRVGASKFMSIPNTWEDDPQSIKKMVITWPSLAVEFHHPLCPASF
jgi:hypothetical protein